MPSHTRKDKGRLLNYGRWVIRWRWPILVLSLLVTLVAASGVERLKFQDDYRYFFREDNPQLVAFEEVQNIYTKNDNILFVLEPAGGNVFTPTTLEAVQRLTAEAWKIPHAIRVDSITNFQHTEAEGDELIVEDLVPDASSLKAAGTTRVRTIATTEPLLRDRLIPQRGHVTGVNVTLELPGKGPKEQTPAVQEARRLVTQFQQEYPGLKIYLTGFAMLNQSFQEASVRDMQTLVPLMFGIIVVIMALLLRSFSATAATVVVIGLSTAVAMGLAGWLGIPITTPTSIAPTMILMLAVADSIHILVTLLQKMRGGAGKRDALVESLRLNVQPVFLTSLTTAIGFLSMNFSDVRPFNDLGNITAMGIGAAFFYSVVLLPALIAVLPIRVKAAAARSRSPLESLAEFVIRRRNPLLWASATTVLALAVWIPANELNDQFVEYFDTSITFRTDTDFVMTNLTGIYQIEYSLGAGESGGISNPEYQAKLDEFAQWFRRQPDVLHVNTLSDTMRRLNRNLHGDDPAWYRLPAERDLAAQYLLLYEMSLPYGLDLNNQINVDKSATRLIVTATNVSTRRLRELVESGELWLQQNAPRHMFNHGVGPGVMFAYVSDRNIKSMLLGTAFAFVLISMCLVVALRSVRFGLLSLIPNLVPVVMAFGVWGLLVGRVNLGLSVVAAVSLGIVVDDTVHFLTKYIRARREQGMSPEDAVRYAFSLVGVAVVVTTVVLVGGFLVLSLSPFDLNSGMGRLTAITIVLALLTDLLLLPALLLKVDAREISRARAGSQVPQAALVSGD